MQGDAPISWLMFFTLAATTFIIAGGFIAFLRSRTNRQIAAEALEGDGSRVGKSRTETAQKTTPVGQTTGMSQGMAQPAGSADQPKVYQPANPTPDTRSAPTSSDTGIGNANGSTGQPK